MKAALVVLLALATSLVGVLAWRLSVEVGASRGLRSEIQVLTAKLADTSTRDALELQAKCAAQAEKVFHAMGYKENQPNGTLDVYQSHYNVAANKCFMTMETTDIHTTPGTMVITKFLLDAFEQREYAEYTWISSKTKKFWEVPPAACKLIPSSGGEQLCRTEDEYKAFVARFME